MNKGLFWNLINSFSGHCQYTKVYIRKQFLRVLILTSSSSMISFQNSKNFSTEKVVFFPNLILGLFITFYLQTSSETLFRTENLILWFFGSNLMCCDGEPEWVGGE